MNCHILLEQKELVKIVSGIPEFKSVGNDTSVTNMPEGGNPGKFRAGMVCGAKISNC
jgi:hypothetical protein